MRREAAESPALALWLLKGTLEQRRDPSEDRGLWGGGAPCSSDSDDSALLMHENILIYRNYWPKNWVLSEVYS